MNEIPPYTGHYLEVLDAMHEILVPRMYLEVGVNTGKSLAAVRPETLAIGIDPTPRVDRPINSTAKVIRSTSDDFFARTDVADVLGDHPIDVSFIDGMHLFEYALRDFRNIERHSHRDSVVFLHDCWPADNHVASRSGATPFWAGDVWKLVRCLTEFRPDLAVRIIMAGPTGLGVVRGLDPGNTVLFDHEDEILARYRDAEWEASRDGLAQAATLVPNDWEAVRSLLPSEPYLRPGEAPAAPTRWPRNLRSTRRRFRVWLSGTAIAPFARTVKASVRRASPDNAPPDAD